ncbi:MAG: hypothetical protein FWE61_05255 [Micrococcales bacterium]|nr:hypothetical protein [Micrococcales bacterium]
MTYLRRVVVWAALGAAVNLVWWGWVVRPVALAVVCVVGCVVVCTVVAFAPRLRWRRGEPWRLAVLADGYELTLAASACAVANIVWWVWLAFHVAHGRGGLIAGAVVNIVVAAVLIFGVAVNGFVRLSIGSTNVPTVTKVLIAVLWWIPPVTVVLLGRACRTSAREIAATTYRLERDRARVGDQVCRTRHPVLMVHGVFFRDWDKFGYWGRIPDALVANGATVSYGNQDASRPVADCAAQLVTAIEQAAVATGKVNIIAHSKGGLDARWAISQLGMADKVASLTTVNTPHRGCRFARAVLDRISPKVQAQIGTSSDAVMTKLGDPAPDFLASVADLTDTECARLATFMPDAPGVLYLSIGSVMASRFAAGFPLNVGYSLIAPADGANDGLVALTSMGWGEYLGTVEPTGRHGLSHGDMIDLLRRDIDGFDICELYVQLVSGLRERGL